MYSHPALLDKGSGFASLRQQALCRIAGDQSNAVALVGVTVGVGVAIGIGIERTMGAWMGSGWLHGGAVERTTPIPIPTPTPIGLRASARVSVSVGGLVGVFGNCGRGIAESKKTASFLGKLGGFGGPRMVGDTGLEPVTPCMSSKCSSQLS